MFLQDGHEHSANSEPARIPRANASKKLTSLCPINRRISSHAASSSGLIA